MLRLTNESTSRSFGKTYFRQLVRNLATALGVRYAFVSECHEDGEGSIQLVAFWKGDDYADPFAYNAAGTPCELVIEKNPVCNPQNVQ